MSSDNRVTQKYIESRIHEVNYIFPNVDPATLTICVITMDTGFHVVGDSACIDPNNFDEDIGRSVAYENAFEQLWKLLAFAMMENVSK